MQVKEESIKPEKKPKIEKIPKQAKYSEKKKDKHNNNEKKKDKHSNNEKKKKKSERAGPHPIGQKSLLVKRSLGPKS